MWWYRSDLIWVLKAAHSRSLLHVPPATNREMVGWVGGQSRIQRDDRFVPRLAKRTGARLPVSRGPPTLPKVDNRAFTSVWCACLLYLNVSRQTSAGRIHPCPGHSNHQTYLTLFRSPKSCTRPPLVDPCLVAAIAAIEPLVIAMDSWHREASTRPRLSSYQSDRRSAILLHYTGHCSREEGSTAASYDRQSMDWWCGLDSFPSSRAFVPSALGLLPGMGVRLVSILLNE